MADDLVISHLKRLLKAAGFQRLDRKKYAKELTESCAEIELQNHSFGKHIHFINVTISFKEPTKSLHGMRDSFGIWLRAEGLDPDLRNQSEEALDAKSDISTEVRLAALDRIINQDLAAFLANWSTFEGAHTQFMSGALNRWAINHELKQMWSLSSA